MSIELKVHSSSFLNDLFSSLPRQVIHLVLIHLRFLFILFDIEIIFMYPWAITFRDFISSGHGTFAFASMMIFLTIFIFGLFWEIKSKALEWD